VVPIKINEFELETITLGTKGWTQLSIMDGLANPIVVPIAVVKGAVAGPILLATAGVHGDEFEGMETIRKLFNELDPAKLQGTFVGIPVINPFAYEGQIRETPALWDGLNLARQFPGSKQGSPTQQLAYHWSSFVTRLLGSNDVFIDFHSAGTRYEYVSMVGFHQTADSNEINSRNLASVFGMERIWSIPDRPDTHVTFNGYISRRGIPTLATEVRGRGGMTEVDVMELLDGLKRLMIYKKMLADESPIIDDFMLETSTVWSSEWLWIAASGFFRPKVNLGEAVKKDQILGDVIDMLGNVLEVVISPINGDVWGIRRFSTLRAGDYTFLIGYKESDLR
jgi:predicted deacylase